jgi:hypothetical protein
MKLTGSEPLFDSEKWPVVGNNCYDYAFGDNRNYRPKKSEPGGTRQFSLFKTCGKGKNSMRSRILSDNPENVYHIPNKKVATPCKPGYYKIMAFVAPVNDMKEPYGDFHFYKQIGAVRYRLAKGDTVKNLAKFFRVKESIISEALKRQTRPRTTTNGMIGELNTNHTGKIIDFPVNLWAHKLGWGTRPLLVDAKGKTIRDPRKANRKYAFHYDTLCGGYCVRPGKTHTGQP